MNAEHSTWRLWDIGMIVAIYFNEYRTNGHYWRGEPDPGSLQVEGKAEHSSDKLVIYKRH